MATRIKREPTEISHNIRLTTEEAKRLEWAAQMTGARGITAFIRSAALEKEMQLRALERRE